MVDCLCRMNATLDIISLGNYRCSMSDPVRSDLVTTLMTFWHSCYCVCACACGHITHMLSTRTAFNFLVALFWTGTGNCALQQCLGVSITGSIVSHIGYLTVTTLKRFPRTLPLPQAWQTPQLCVWCVCVCVCVWLCVCVCVCESERERERDPLELKGWFLHLLDFIYMLVASHRHKEGFEPFSHALKNVWIFIR